MFARRLLRDSSDDSPYLDFYVPDVVYSLRKRLNSYSGNLVRVRRSSDNTERDFGLIGDLLDVAAITSWLGGATPYLTTVYSQTGDNHLIQTNTSLQPRLNLSGSYPTIQITDSNSYLVLTTRLTNIVSVFLALFHSTGSGTYEPILGDATAYDFIAPAGTGLFNTEYITNFSYVFINGAIKTIAEAIKPTSLSLVTVFATDGHVLTVGNVANDRLTYGRSWTGEFAEIVLFSSDKNDKRQEIQTKLASPFYIKLY